MQISINESPMRWLASQGPENWKKFLAKLKPSEKMALEHQWRNWRARRNQLAPEGDWRVWLIIAGRGFGKTRAGAEWVREQVERGIARRIALIAETEAEGRDVMVQGDSGILQISPPHFRPLYEPSKRRLTWPNGALAMLYSGDEPDQLRGPQHDACWADEPCKWKYLSETWDNLEFGLRLGAHPRVVATTTPRPVKLLRRLLNDPKTVVTRGSTFDNAANLSPSFLDRVRSQYDGTRLGRQELYAEVLDEVPGALWQRHQIEECRVNPKAVPDLKRVVVAIDPAVSTSEEADETGIIVAGLGVDGKGYILADLSCKLSPDGWARRTVAGVRTWKADRVVAEVNNGGDMVAATLKMVDPRIPFKAVRASRGKIVRAEPVAALYEQGRICHAGRFEELEDQQCSFTPDNIAGNSPDRADALVWALSELFVLDSTPGFLGYLMLER
jgi:predicted phage terminase large subunit-like protein